MTRGSPSIQAMRRVLGLWGLAAALLAMPMLGAANKNLTGGFRPASLNYYQIWANAPTPFDYGPSDSAVSLDGKILIFGSEGWGPDGFSRQGGVFVYLKTKDGYIPQQLIQPPADQWGYPSNPSFMAFPSIYPRFGASVGLSHSGKVLAFGAPIRKNNNLDTNTNFGANNEGAVFIYHLNSKTNLYEEVAGPLVPSTVYGSRVGQGVAVSGDGSVVCAGAPGWAPTAPPASNRYGAVYCWLHNKVANTYDLLPGMPLVGPSQDSNEFGTKVSLSKSGEWLAVGAPELDTSTLLNAGAVFIYQRSSKAGQYTLVNSFNGTQDDAALGFALSFGAKDTALAVGAPFGQSDSVQIYSLSKPSKTWAPSILINGSVPFGQTDYTGGSPYFGQSVALAYKTPTLVVGAPEYDLDNYVAPGYPNPLSEDNIGAIGVYKLDLKNNAYRLAYGPYFPTFWTVDSYSGTTVAVNGDGKLFTGGAMFYGGDGGLSFAYRLLKSYASKNVVNLGGGL